MGAHLSRTTIEAARIVDESVNKLKATLAKRGMTLDEWLEQERIKTEEIRRKRLEREARESKKAKE